jgi:hypothetical protein
MVPADVHRGDLVAQVIPWVETDSLHRDFTVPIFARRVHPMMPVWLQALLDGIVIGNSSTI